MNVSWEDAQQYVGWLSRRTGRGYRLLTEAEWEYAARAGTVTPYSFGRSFAPTQANYSDDRPRVVGSYAANAWGLHDMHGNLYEWVQDCYVASYAGAPSDAARAVETGGCSARVLRGGSWYYTAQLMRAAFRFRNSPGLRITFIGFRVARTPG